jgi:hypothetical protein
MEEVKGGPGTPTEPWQQVGGGRPIERERVIPNPKLKLMDQVKEVMRLKHYSIRTERCYSDWIRRYVHFHRMKSRTDLDGGERKIEEFLRVVVLCDLCGLGVFVFSSTYRNINGHFHPSL